MADSLTKQIVEAREAAALLAEGDRLQELAERLPELEAEAERREQRHRAKWQFEEVQAEAAAQLDAARESVQEWRRRFEVAIAEVQALIDDLPGCQEPIYRAGYRLRAASQALAQAQLDAKGGGPAMDLQIGAPGLGLFAEAWSRLGVGPEFAAIPGDLQPGSLGLALLDLIQKRTQAVIYLPSLGIRQLVRR